MNRFVKMENVVILDSLGGPCIHRGPGSRKERQSGIREGSLKTVFIFPPLYMKGPLGDFALTPTHWPSGQATWITKDMECKPSREGHCKLERGKVRPSEWKPVCCPCLASGLCVFSECHACCLHSHSQHALSLHFFQSGFLAPPGNQHNRPSCNDSQLGVPQ